MIDNLQQLRKKKISESMYTENYLSLVDYDKPNMAKSISNIEKVLIAKLVIGNTLAFSDIFEAYYKDLVIFAFRFTRDKSIAEEVVQDTFLKLWEEHESVNICISLKSYLLKIVQNKCIDWHRHQKIMQNHNAFVMECPPQFECNTDSYVLHSELQEQIQRALKKLPDEISESFRMNRFQGLKYHEIAEVYGVSVRTIEVRIGKALNMLRSSLKNYLLLIIGFFSLLFSNLN